VTLSILDLPLDEGLLSRGVPSPPGPRITDFPLGVLTHRCLAPFLSVILNSDFCYLFFSSFLHDFSAFLRLEAVRSVLQLGVLLHKGPSSITILFPFSLETPDLLLVSSFCSPIFYRFSTCIAHSVARRRRVSPSYIECPFLSCSWRCE